MLAQEVESEKQGTKAKRKTSDIKQAETECSDFYPRVEMSRFFTIQL
jgi:hypothetical protein